MMAEQAEVRVLDLQNFLRTLEVCRGSVTLQFPDGSTVSTAESPDFRTILFRQHKAYHGCLRLSLEFSLAQDYVRILQNCAEECFQFFCPSFFIKKLPNNLVEE